MKIFNRTDLKSRARQLLTPFGLQLCALLAVAVFFRFWHIANIPGINGDEAYMAYKSLRLSHGEVFHATLSWSTNAEATPDVFYLWPLTLLHLVFGPSVTLIRIIAVFSGILTLPLNFVLCRRAFDTRSAAVSTMALAVLPVTIAYSRFGWEPSQSVAVTALTMYLALFIVRDPDHSIKWSILACLSLPAAYIVHATNVLVAPLVAVALLVRWWPALAAAVSGRASLAARAILAVGVMVAAGGVCFVLNSPAVSARLKWHPPSEIPWFLISYSRLFSGATTYRYIPGSFPWVTTPEGVPIPDPRWWDVAFLFIAAGFFFYICARLRRAPRDACLVPDRCLVAGWVLMFVLFFAAAGSKSLFPGSERYGLCLVAPSVLVFSRAIVLLMEQRPRAISTLNVLLSIVAWLSLGGFYICYFRFFEQTGGNLTAQTFRTGSVEPRLAALTYVRKSHRTGATDCIVASDWWNDWPVRYLAANDEDIVVLNMSQMNEPKFQKTLNSAYKSHSMWFVNFPEDESSKTLMAGMQSEHVPFENHEITSYGGQTILRLVRPMPPASR